MVQRLTARVTGRPVLQLVNKTDTNAAATAGPGGSEGQRKKQKRVSSQEDEELYRKLREGKTWRGISARKRNWRSLSKVFCRRTANRINFLKKLSPALGYRITGILLRIVFFVSMKSAISSDSHPAKFRSTMETLLLTSDSSKTRTPVVLVLAL